MKYDEITYLINGCGEDTNRVSPEALTALGLSYGQLRDKFYPLTTEERFYVSEEYANIVGGFMAHMGYAVLYKGEKMLCLNVEFSFGEESGDRDMTKEDALHYAELFKELWGADVKRHGGTMILTEDFGLDRHEVEILLPFTFAYQYTTFETYKAAVEKLLGVGGHLSIVAKKLKLASAQAEVKVVAVMQAYVDGSLNMKTWMDNKDGNIAAERYFREQALAKGYDEEDIATALEDGILEGGGEVVMHIIHS